MKFSDSKELWEILKDARVLTRQEREEQILREFSRLDALQLLKDQLEQYFATPSLDAVDDAEFNAAATLAWTLIRQLRKNEIGSVH